MRLLWIALTLAYLCLNRFLEPNQLCSHYLTADLTTCHTSIDRYIFFADKVEIQDITGQTSLFVLIGPRSNQVGTVSN